VIELQRKLIGDAVRNQAFNEALRSVIDPKKTTVLDLGSGTGFLGFLASRLGAKHVTLIEYGDILDVSRKLAKRNHIENCTFIKKHSMEVRNLERVDVLVSETLGNYALEENIIESVEDGKKFLRKGGTIIPGKITQFVCPVVAPRLQDEIDVWNAGFDLDFKEAREVSMNNMYVKTVRPDELLDGGAKQWDSIDFSKQNASIREASLVWEMASAVTVYGFALWWDAELVSGIHLSTSPFEKPTHWEQIYLPLLSPMRLGKGEEISLQLRSDTRLKVKVNLQWTAIHKGLDGTLLSKQEFDMRKGHLN
jgi:protein arginine N-methyltransferase 1